ncbi:ribonuclease h2 subunit a [Phtheirospermum japonicum]|uniref:Ribonuclease n=1 Tax=Phtheirospermum japonicum TaxID=374723 RepID=A0A830D5D2_9LAMI|nr:ribonuclease h2 subunit a [Phtheirospermum japonicum]
MGLIRSLVLGYQSISSTEISHDSAIGLINKVLNIGVLLTEVYLDTVGDAEKYQIKLSERFPNIKFVVAKKADSLYPIVSGASIVAKVTRDRSLRDWVLDETEENLQRNFGSGYPGDPQTKAWLKDHQHPVFGFPTLVRFSWEHAQHITKTLSKYYGNLILMRMGMERVENGKRSYPVLVSPLERENLKTLNQAVKVVANFFQARQLEQIAQF